MLLDGQQHGGQPGRLHADDFYLGTQLLDGASDAGNQAASAYRYDHSFQLRALLEEFKADGALPGDDRDVVEGVQEHLTLLAGELQSVLAGLIVIDAVEDYVAAITLRRRHFHQRSGGGHDDGAANAALRGVIGDSLRVISRRSADDAALLFFRAEQQDFVERAAFLVRAGHLQIFELEIDLLACGGGEFGGIRARGHVDRSANAVGGFADHGQQFERGGLVHACLNPVPPCRANRAIAAHRGPVRGDAGSGAPAVPDNRARGGRGRAERICRS